MLLFLASNIGGIKKENGKKVSTKFFEDNMFLTNLKKSIKNNKKFVLVASNPEIYEMNDLFLQMDIDALKLSGLSFDEYIVLDNRNKINIEYALKDSSLIFLCGGNTKMQNDFFNEIELGKYLKDVDSVVVGISAGSINCAKDAFNSPECNEDLKDSPYLNGLDLTNINIEPHFVLDDLDNDNKILQRNSIIDESYKRTIYALTDGAYILETNNSSTLFGKSYKISNGIISQICDDEEYVDIIKE